ncbi:uncharacterized protein LTR77_007885 [Saxophila tyrrhenica]|uniref:Cytochrome P450 n=1 Tax=Saxophila tyrrhenica TaxID=1690608 RepID=A0AAV9P677_9PEZI|nr:hypothetical protein LTR77_007885 [Saxophila tyrrhenica]
MREYFGESEEWQTQPLKEAILNLVARLSSRVFLGKDLCRDPAWLNISKNYTVDVFMAANLMRLVPGPLRPLLYWFIPTNTRLRREVRDARQLILPEVERRRKRAEDALEAGEKPPKTADTIGWMVEIAQARGRAVDYVPAQLSLTMAAIHTTTETTTKCILQLCDTPEIVQPLREEVIQVLREEGWTKVALGKMRLLDSFLKEVQRTHGLATTSMNRLVKNDIILSDGTKLPKGSRILVPDDRTHDPSIFPEPEKFDVSRFLTLREQSGGESKHQFVTTTSDHLGFGHGQHACPGRFFASNEMKIALSFILLRYDLKFPDGEGRPKDLAFETANMTAPNLKVQIRRRKEEIDGRDPQQPLQAA